MLYSQTRFFDPLGANEKTFSEENAYVLLQWLNVLLILMLGANTSALNQMQVMIVEKV